MRRRQRVKSQRKLISRKRRTIPRRGHRLHKTKSPFRVRDKQPAQETASPRVEKQVSAIVCGCSEETKPVVQQLLQLSAMEVILILEHSEAEQFDHLREQQGLTLVYLPVRLSPNECRSIGAAIASGEILLFVDGKMPFDEKTVRALLRAIDRGADLALTDQMPDLGIFRQWSDADRVQAFVNWSLGHAWLQANSVDHLPHAWSAKGAAMIGKMNLISPALAQEAAIAKKLNILVIPGSFASRQRSRAERVHGAERIRLSIGDQVEALTKAMKQRGVRLDFSDRVRRRSMFGGAD